MSSTVETALIAKIQDLTSLETVFYGRNPRGPEELPCVVVEKTGEEREDTFDSQATNIPYTFQIRVWSHDPETSVNIYQDIRNGLDAFSGDMDGFPIAYASFEGDSDEIRDPGDGSEQWVYGRFLTFLIISEGEG